MPGIMSTEDGALNERDVSSALMVLMVSCEGPDQ